MQGGSCRSQVRQVLGGLETPTCRHPGVASGFPSEETCGIARSWNTCAESSQRWRSGLVRAASPTASSGTTATGRTTSARRTKRDMTLASTERQAPMGTHNRTPGLRPWMWLQSQRHRSTCSRSSFQASFCNHHHPHHHHPRHHHSHLITTRKLHWRASLANASTRQQA